MTDGVLPDPQGGPPVKLDALSSNQLKELWVFINHKAQFDMDASLFEAFNKEFRARVK